VERRKRSRAIRCNSLLAAGWAFFLSSVLTGCSPKDDAIRPVRVLSFSQVSTLDPAKISWLVDMRAASALFEGLTTINPRTLQVEAAQAYYPPEISEDKTTYRFHIRPEAKWSTGRAVVADDFVFAWKRVLDPLTGSPYVQLMFNIRNARRYYQGLAGQGERIEFDQVGVKALSRDTLEVQLEAPVAYFLDLTSFITFVPVARENLEPFAKRLADGRVVYDSDWTLPQHLITNGPFLLREWKMRQRMRFERNELYWDRRRVGSRYVDLVGVEDRATAWRLYDSGQADLMPFMPPGRIADVLLKQQADGRREDVHAVRAFGTYFYRLNVKKPPLDDVRVRRALAMAIDKRAIAEKVRGHGEKVADSFVPPGTGDYVSPEGLPFDPDRARRLLAEAGYPQGRGAPTIEILFNVDPVGGHRDTASAVKQMWQENLGLTVELRALDRSSFWEKVKNLDYMVARGGWWGDYYDPMTFLDMFVTAPPQGGNNDTGFSDPRYDELVGLAAVEPDAVKRNALLQEAERILVCQQAPIIPVYHYVEMYLFDPKRVGGVWPNSRSIIPLKYLYLRPAAGPGLKGEDR